MTMTFDTLLERATDSFAAAAHAGGLVDVQVTTLDTPVGALLLAATDAGVVRVAFDSEDHDAVLAQLAASISPRVVQAAPTGLLADARAQLDAYFAGERDSFDLPLDLRLARGEYRREVLALLRTIPPGQTRTYAQLAVESGRPKAVRAVGTGCATNPLPVVVPCHRVLRTGGELGGYLGGVERKQWLLDHEREMSAA
jgi:methylated-DNA-[protein]-cysteine S-methyltransferase